MQVAYRTHSTVQLVASLFNTVLCNYNTVVFGSHDLAGVFKNEPLPDVIVDLKTIKSLATVKVKLRWIVYS